MIPGIMMPPPLTRETGTDFVAIQTDTVSSSTMATLGAVAGDLVFVFAVSGGTPTLSGGVALTSIGGGGYYKKLVSGDLTRNVTNSNIVTVMILRGGSTVASVVTDSANGSVTNRSVAGYTKNAAHYGQFGIVHSTTPDATLSIGSPAAFAQRALYNPSLGGIHRIYLATRFQPVNPYYLSGTPFLWSSDGSFNGLKIFEVRL